MNRIYIYILCMAITTYLIRMLPLVLFKKEITSSFLKSFLFYVPYACLACMTFPAILESTTYLISAIVGLITAVVLAYREKSLISVALFACVSVFITERIIELLQML